MVAIKDFGMPSCCVNCDCCLPCAFNEGLCHITQHTIGNIYDNRPSDCPLVEIEERKLEKLEKIEQIVNASSYTENTKVYSYCYDNDTRVKHIRKVLEQD